MSEMTERQVAALYDEIPLVIACAGGPRDGVTVTIQGREPPERYCFAVDPPPLDPSRMAAGNWPPPAVYIPVDYYRYAGSVRDDGARIYRYEGRM